MAKHLFQKGQPAPAGAGRPPGSTNKATAMARHAIAAFVDGNAHRLQDWLNDIANGIPLLDPETREQKLTATGQLCWIREPDPEKAFTLFKEVIEYHVPKLARTELVGDPDAPLQLAGADAMRGLSDSELATFKQLLAKAAAVQSAQGAIAQ